MQKNKRKYYRKCGCCGERMEQSDMIRSDNYPGGWVCLECFLSDHKQYTTDEW